MVLYVFCTTVRVGLKLFIQEPGLDHVQNWHYNRWFHEHYVNSVFIFAPDSKIMVCHLNTSGTVCDSAVVSCCDLYNDIDNSCKETGAKVVVDSVFNLGNKPFLINSSQKDPGDAEVLLVNQYATYVR